MTNSEERNMSEATLPPVEQKPLSIEDVEAALLALSPMLPVQEPFEGDPSATWEYWNPMFDRKGIAVPDEWVWKRLRLKRNALIADCDWRVIADAPWDDIPWKQYRQALRDLPEQTADPRQVAWPTAPTG